MTKFFDPGLEKKPDFVKCMERIYAWYDHQVLDRVPIRFSAHNAEYDIVDRADKWACLKDRWFDTEYQVNKALAQVETGSYLGETFPLFWPNLGPNVFAGMFGCKLKYADVTSWALPFVEDADDLDKIAYDPDNELLRKLDELTDCALERGKGKFLVGYTDMHPGLDFAAALMGTENMFMQTVEDIDFVREILRRAEDQFFVLMDAFHEKLRANNQLSVTWMDIPSYETVHIPSCDHGAMISTKLFCDLALPFILEEVRHFKHNIFHVDGPGVANHLDVLLEIPEIQAIQWVQVPGLGRPIMQWVPLIKKVQAAGKSVVVDLQLHELEDFMAAVRPEGILLCLDESDPDTQRAVLDRLLKWK